MSVYPFEKAAFTLKAIAHPVRLEIITILEKGPKNVMQIQDELNIKQSMTSQHLKALADKEILKREKSGNRVFYSINKKEVLALLSCIKRCCETPRRG